VVWVRGGGLGNKFDDFEIMLEGFFEVNESFLIESLLGLIYELTVNRKIRE